MRTMKTLLLGLCLGWALVTVSAQAADRVDPKDPLSKFSDENLIDIGFCFNEFVKAVGSGDAVIAKAFLQEVPNDLAKLDLTKDADKKTFLKRFAHFKGAQIISSQRMAITGLGMVKYSDSNGGEKEQRMKNVGGRWKITL